MRQSFGNNFDPILPEAVKKVREAAVDQNSFYQIEDIMKQHSIAGWEKWLNAGTETAAKNVADELAPFKATLSGGDALKGKKVFFESEKVRCNSCHKVGNSGNDIAPDLTKIGATKNREYLLTSLVAPSHEISKGLEVTMLKTNDGRVVMGVIKSDGDKIIKIAGADGKLVEVEKQQIKSQKVLKESAMPPMGEVLTKDEIRDLIEYLCSLK